MSFPGVIADKEHPTTILKHTMADGKVMVYADDKGGAERAEISAPNGTVVLIKDYETTPEFAKYKRIVCYNLDKELKGTIDIIQEGEIKMHPGFKFYDKNQEIGTGSGDIVSFIAQKLLGEDIIDPRYAAGALVSEEVIDTINRMIPPKVAVPTGNPVIQ
jgi:hypothetical protein